MDFQEVLGILYYKGEYVKHNINMSIRYLSLASKQCDKKASYYLGYIYYEGKYIERNIQDSIHYYKESSSFEFYFAKFNLAIINKKVF